MKRSGGLHRQRCGSFLIMHHDSSSMRICATCRLHTRDVYPSL
jgi:hypothetical protein